MILDKNKKQQTQVFKKVDMDDDGTQAILLQVYTALSEKGTTRSIRSWGTFFPRIRLILRITTARAA